MLEAIQELHERFDAWVNPTTGEGTSSDPSSSGVAVPSGPVHVGEARTLLHEDELGYVIANRPVEDALKLPPAPELLEDPGGETSAALSARATELDAWPVVREAARYARAYGGAVVLVGIEGQSANTPLDWASIPRITHFTAFSPEEVSVSRIQANPLLRGYGEPTEYKLTGNISSPGQPSHIREQFKRVHASRVIVFPGEPADRVRRESNSHWDDSVFARMRGALRDNATTWSALTALIGKANMLALKLSGLRGFIAGHNGAESEMRKRLNLLRMGIGVLKMVAVDADKEEIQNISTSFGGLPEVVDRLMIRLSAVSGIPVAILWGRSPAGQNATGDADWRNWEDFVARYRVGRLDAPILRLYRLLMAEHGSATKGQVLPDFKLAWPKLRELSETEVAEIRSKDAVGLVALVREGVFTAEEVAIALSSNNGYSRDISINVEAREAAIADWEAGEHDNDGTDDGNDVDGEG